jgi:hypothetical protein
VCRGGSPRSCDLVTPMIFRKLLQGFIFGLDLSLSAASLDLYFPLGNLQSRKKPSRSHELEMPNAAPAAWDAAR